MKHIPVLLDEVLSHLNIKPGDVVVDATLGAGGYASVFAEAVAPGGTLIAIDRDKEAVQAFLERADQAAYWGLSEERTRIIHGNYSNIREILRDGGVDYTGAIAADLGISSDQLDDPDRGLRFDSETSLDMRLDRSEDTPSVRDMVNGWSEERLAEVLFRNADEKHSRKIARKIKERRKESPIATAKELAEIVESAVPRKGRSIHPATKTFQALRMEVNRELEHVERFLREAIECLCPGGRLAVVSFHSGEDRLVKEVFAEYAKGCVCPPEFPVCRCGRLPSIRKVTGKPIRPSEEEIRKNPRSRSARLRVAEKV